MASESGACGVSRILGKGLPTVTNWLDVNWLVALFALSLHGVEFHALQPWAREVTQSLALRICMTLWIDLGRHQNLVLGEFPEFLAERCLP